jgi:adenine-specific DNA-methyltransferase
LGLGDLSGQIRSRLAEDIVRWRIDATPDGEGFSVIHAYFTSADEPHEKVKRALRAEIFKTARAILYPATSRPFAPPATGKIAVKVISHYGDEVLKVYELGG